MSVKGRVKNAWNAFRGRDPTTDQYIYYGDSSGINPTIPMLTGGNARSIVSALYNQIAVDCSSVDIKHVKVDENGRYSETINDSLNDVLTYSANIDQTGRGFIQDIVTSMLDEGVVAVVPFEMDIEPFDTDAFKVLKARTGRITQWYPQHVEVELYNEDTGNKQRLRLEKRICAIIENPFFITMNEPNSIAQRLKRVLRQLDNLNNKVGSDKLDLIVQFPYPIKGETLTKRAKARQNEIEEQLTGSRRGIAYIDSTEKVIQLNRSIDNNLWEQAKDLTSQLFNQLGFSESIFNGTADEKTMLNYNNRTIEPILSAIVEEMRRKWISPTSRTQGKTIMFFKDPFRLVPVEQIAEIADKFTRNEIASSNEIRSAIGMRPSDDPKADELRNSNLNHPDEKN